MAAGGRERSLVERVLLYCPVVVRHSQCRCCFLSAIGDDDDDDDDDEVDDTLREKR